MAAAPHQDHPTRARIARHLDGRGGASAEQIAAALGLHPNTVRFHLARLVDTGRVSADEAPPSGRGRPRRIFSARPHMDRDGRRDYLTLARMVLEGIAQAPEARSIARIAGRRWGTTLAAAHRGEDLTAVLDGMGFAPRRSVAGDAMDLHQCPFLEAVDSHGDLVCEAHLGLMRALAEALEPGTDVVRLESFSRPGVCVATLAGRPHHDERTHA